MVNSALLALLLTAGAVAVGPEIYDALAPEATLVTATESLRPMLQNAQALEDLGMSRHDALLTTLEETPNFSGSLFENTLVMTINDVTYCGINIEHSPVINPCVSSTSPDSIVQHINP